MAHGRRKQISAKPEHTGELSQATEKIHGLLEELTSTVESAERLTRNGEPERALRMVEGQRESLYDAVDTIARTVSVKRARFEKLRTRTPILVAAALFAVSALAISVGAITAIHSQTPAEARLRRAEQISDPGARLTAIYATYRDTVRSNPAAVAPGTALNKDMTKALTKTKTDMQGDPSKEQLVEQAKVLIDAVSKGEAPPAPQTPPPPTPPSGAPSGPPASVPPPGLP